MIKNVLNESGEGLQSYSIKDGVATINIQIYHPEQIKELIDSLVMEPRSVCQMVNFTIPIKEEKP